MEARLLSKMAKDGSSASAYDQICFSGESNCQLFRAHFLKPDMCTSCMKEIGKHTRDAVESEGIVLRVGWESVLICKKANCIFLVL